MCEKVMRIEEVRRAWGMSRKELADEMGVTQAVILHWEREEYLPKVRQLPALADAMGCSIDELFVRN